MCIFALKHIIIHSFQRYISNKDISEMQHYRYTFFILINAIIGNAFFISGNNCMKIGPVSGAYKKLFLLAVHQKDFNPAYN